MFAFAQLVQGMLRSQRNFLSRQRRHETTGRGLLRASFTLSIVVVRGLILRFAVADLVLSLKSWRGKLKIIGQQIGSYQAISFTANSGIPN